ncbi:MAG: hypothetical protein ACRCY4_02475 [Brevinema sp.]
MENDKAKGSELLPNEEPKKTKKKRLTAEDVSQVLGLKPVKGAIQLTFRAIHPNDLMIVLELKKIADEDYRGNMTATIFSLLRIAIDHENDQN